MFSVSAFLFVYLAVSGAAFFFDIFHVNGVLAATALAEAVILGWNRWVKRRTPVPLDGWMILLGMAYAAAAVAVGYVHYCRKDIR